MTSRVANYQAQAEESALKPRDYLDILRRRKWSFFLVTILIVAGGLAYSYRQTPLYQSEAEVLVQQTVESPADSPTLSLPNLETERELAESEAVATPVAQRLGGSPGELQSGLSVEWRLNTEILVFHYINQSPLIAQRRADAFARGYLRYRRQQVLDDLLAVSGSVQKRIQKLNAQLDRISGRVRKTNDQTERTTLEGRANALVGQIALLQQELADLTPPSQLKVGQIVGSANLPLSPVNPNPLVIGLFSLVAGGLLGIAVAFLREHFDDHLRGRDDLEFAVGSHVLASVPRVANWRRRNRPMLVTLAQPDSAATETYKILRTGLLFAAAEQDVRVIMITSAHVGEGKTVTTANLGVALAQAGKRVILISADLRKPRLHHFFDLANHTGLTNVLTGRVSPWQAVSNTRVENLQVMPSGPVPTNPAELLGSEAMGEVLSVPSEIADYILVDAAPVLAVADAATLAPLTDSVLFVADAQRTHRGAVEQARRRLEQVNAQFIGAVLNNFDPSKAGAYSYYRYSYRYEEPGKATQQPEEAEERTNVLRWRSGSTD
jgi:capsular exopolysaccharide synthesis family protein